MIRYRASTWRLYPTPEQAAQMAQHAGACRFVYNLALEQRRDWWRQHKATTGWEISFPSQCRELTMLRAEVDWIREVSSSAVSEALRDLDRTFRKFFSGRAGYPRPRKRGVNDSFRFRSTDKISTARHASSSGSIRLPKIGWVRMRGGREILGELRNVTVSHRAGKWFAAIKYKQEVAVPEKSLLPGVGIDMGIAVFAALSNGTNIAAKDHGNKTLRSLRKAQRALARKKRGSSNRRKAVRRIAALHQRVANARKDFLHKNSTMIAKNHGVVVMEALQIKPMTGSAKGPALEPGRNVRQKSGLNRSILKQGWGIFRTMLRYKLAERGGTLVEVPAAYTSQTCSACGHVDAENRKTQSAFSCVRCNHEANADTNAAINILRRMDRASKPVEGNRLKRPVEAGTNWRAA